MFVAILEDDGGRQDVMRSLLPQVLPTADIEVFDNSPEMIDWLSRHLDEVLLISLDHDLGPNRGHDERQFDPGDGRDVVDFLAELEPTAPVIVHTSNGVAAPGMVLALETSGWQVRRVVPFDDLAWLESDWQPTVRELVSAGCSSS